MYLLKYNVLNVGETYKSRFNLIKGKGGQIVKEGDLTVDGGHTM